LAFGVLPEKQYRRLAECPLQVNVADLLAAVPVDLAGRALLSLDEPGIGQELVDPGKRSMSSIS
jgi:hypothetical protein